MPVINEFRYTSDVLENNDDLLYQHLFHLQWKLNRFIFIFYIICDGGVLENLRYFFVNILKRTYFFI